MFTQYTVVDTVFDKDQIPQKVHEAIRQLWADRELGNDYYYITPFSENADDGDDETVVYNWLVSQGLNPDKVLIHYWW